MAHLGQNRIWFALYLRPLRRTIFRGNWQPRSGRNPVLTIEPCGTFKT